MRLYLRTLQPIQVIYICGRGFIWSLQDPDEAEKDGSIHISRVSQQIFKSSPLLTATLHYSLTVDQVLDLKSILEEFFAKFSKDWEAILARYFEDQSNLQSFVKILNLESKLKHNESRSLLNEYLASPHSCNLRYNFERILDFTSSFIYN